VGVLDRQWDPAQRAAVSARQRHAGRLCRAPCTLVQAHGERIERGLDEVRAVEHRLERLGCRQLTPLERRPELEGGQAADVHRFSPPTRRPAFQAARATGASRFRVGLGASEDGLADALERLDAVQIDVT
jgi:hypothetical protein